MRTFTRLCCRYWSKKGSCSDTPSQELVVTMAPNPTSQGSTAFVGTVDNQSYEMGQEDGGETLVTTDREDVPTMPNNAEIEDDS